MNRKPTTALLLFVTAAALPAQSLRERIAARRVETEARARAEMAAKGLDRKSMAARIQYDPEQDPKMLRITKHHVPQQSIMGLGSVAGTHSRFIATAPRRTAGDQVSMGAKVFFYDASDGPLHLAGQGIVRKIRSTRKGDFVEAEIESFKWAELRGTRMRAMWMTMTSEASKVLMLVQGKKPKNERWYMSAKLEGPDVEGWGIEEMQRFSLGQPWKGMSAAALEALQGRPDQKLEVGNEASFVYGVGEEAVSYVIKGGVVVSMMQAGGPAPGSGMGMGTGPGTGPGAGSVVSGIAQGMGGAPAPPPSSSWGGRPGEAAAATGGLQPVPSAGEGAISQSLFR